MKEKFIKSVLILLFGGGITKLLGMIIRVVMSRMMGTELLGLYMLILPTFSLFISIGQFGMPIALSKLVAEDKKNNVQLFFSVIPITLIVNFILILIIVAIAPFLSTNLLHNRDCYLGIISIAFVIPFTSISSICRSYFFGKEKMIPHVVSNIIEDFSRLIIMIIGIPFFINCKPAYLLAFLILTNVISESVSVFVLLFFLPNKFSLKNKGMRPKKIYIKEILSIGIPNTTGRLIGSLGYFLEPILLSTVLVYSGYSTSFITKEYGILSGYVMPILLLPSFFTSAISNALLPVISKDYSNMRYDAVIKKLKSAIFISILIGGFFTCISIIFSDFLLLSIYNTTHGVNYMRFLAPICLFQYLQSPLSFCLDAMGKSKDVMFSSVLGMITRTILLVVFSLFKIGIWGLIFAISINVLVVTFYDFIKVLKALNH